MIDKIFFSKKNISKDLKKYSKIFLITDKNLRKLYNNFIEHLNTDLVISITPGESSKSFSQFQKISEELLDKGIDRNSVIIAFGGGVVGDIAGFTASTILRGVEFILIPTSLLAMADSSIGGKTAINTKSGKNLIGSFYKPTATYIDIGFLESLPRRHLVNGYCEILKIAMSKDKIFYQELLKNHQKLLSFDQTYIFKIIKKAVKLKAEIVEKDFTEKNIRAILNFGHSFGHSFEHATSYSNKLLHGEAVALGILPTLFLSKELFDFQDSEINNYYSHIKQLNLLRRTPSITVESIINTMMKDKKNISGKFNLVLLESIGNARLVKNVSMNSIIKSLQSVGY